MVTSIDVKLPSFAFCSSAILEYDGVFCAANNVHVADACNHILTACCCHKPVVRLTCLRNFLQRKLIATSNLYIKCRTSAKTKLRSHFPGFFSGCRTKMDDIIGFQLTGLGIQFFCQQQQKRAFFSVLVSLEFSLFFIGAVTQKIKNNQQESYFWFRFTLFNFTVKTRYTSTLKLYL